MYFIDVFIHLVEDYQKPMFEPNPKTMKIRQFLKSRFTNPDFVTNLTVLIMLVITSLYSLKHAVG